MKNMNLILYKVKDQKYTNVNDRKLTSIDDLKLDNDEIYIIIDKHMKRPKIWIWSGPDSKLQDRYFAGVSATKIKSKERLYGATIEVVECGNEPDQFPILTKEKISEPTKEGKPFIIEEKEVAEPTTEEMVGIEVESVTTSIEDSQPKPLKIVEKMDFITQQKVISLLKEISQDLEKLQNKINIFLMDL